MDKIELELKLTVAHVNAILAHLARGAYADVADLIAHIRGQAQPQVDAATPVSEVTPVPEQAAQ